MTDARPLSGLASEKYSRPTVWSPGTRTRWQSLKCCEISQFSLKCYTHLSLHWGRGSITHSNVAKPFVAAAVWSHFCCYLTTITSLPPTPCVWTTQLTDLAHLSSKTTSRCRRMPSFIGRSSTITSTWKALQKNMEKSFWKVEVWPGYRAPCVCPTH